MEKKYQVFISSTYTDLKEERQKVIQTIVNMNHMPSGMELFPAADEDQFEFIKKVIDDCDYYLLIIGDRYGSITKEGLSYTEKEYDYAVEKGIKVIAFLMENPTSIENPEINKRLLSFRDKVSEGRIVKHWKSAEDLQVNVMYSLFETIKRYPALGWIRADRASSEELLNEINEIRKENDRLKNKIAGIENRASDIQNLADMNDTFKLKASTKVYNQVSKEVTWREIFSSISPYLLEPYNENTVELTLGKHLFGDQFLKLNNQDFKTIKIQLMALNLINTAYAQTVGAGMGIFWNLTPKGKALMLEFRAIKKKV